MVVQKERCFRGPSKGAPNSFAAIVLNPKPNFQKAQEAFDAKPL